MIIRVVPPPDHSSQRRLPDGRLWCGHAERDVARDENGAFICRKCTETWLILRKEEPRG